MATRLRRVAYNLAILRFIRAHIPKVVALVSPFCWNRGALSGSFAGRFCLLLLACATSGVATLRGQSALDGFNPNASNLILAVVVQPDGKILLGGGFSTLSPNGGAAVTRNR